MEVICAKKNSTHKSKVKKISKILKKEKLINQFDYDRFNLRVQNSKKKLLLFLKKQKKNDVIGYGASTKGNDRQSYG